MFAFGLTILAVSTAVFAEQVPCLTGVSDCSGHSSLSIIGGQVYCCPSGFLHGWTTETLANGTTHAVCTCNRQYYETDCLPSASDCPGSTHVLSDGRCCQTGQVMSLSSQTLVSAASIECKCRQYVPLATTSNGTREMTPEESASFTQTMTGLGDSLNTLLTTILGKRNQP